MNMTKTNYEIHVEDAPTRKVAMVHRRGPMAEVGDAVGTGLGHLYEVIGSVGVQPAGMPFVVYLEVGDEVDMELCVPVKDGFESHGDVRSGTVEGGAVATTVHRGPYEAIGPAYEALTEWIHSHDAEIAGPPREFYLNDPRDGAVPETEIEYPIR
jgi:effector-binding domain-containing protein